MPVSLIRSFFLNTCLLAVSILMLPVVITFLAILLVGAATSFVLVLLRTALTLASNSLGLKGLIT